MAARTYVDVFCDNCGSWESGGGTAQVRRARAHVARHYGYRTTYVDGHLVDLCPQCPTLEPTDADRINNLDWNTLESVDVTEAFRRITAAESSVRPEISARIDQIVAENAAVWTALAPDD